jgi:segregation and condensation protein A
MSDILAALKQGAFLPFMELFRPQEGRMGVTITFVAILELMREGLIDIVQAQPYAPLHVRAASGMRTLHLVEGQATAAGSAAALPAPAADGEEIP